MADRSRQSCQPRILPHNCERLQGLERNHTPVSPSIKTGELIGLGKSGARLSTFQFTSVGVLRDEGERCNPQESSRPGSRRCLHQSRREQQGELRPSETRLDRSPRGAKSAFLLGQHATAASARPTAQSRHLPRLPSPPPPARWRSRPGSVLECP